MILILTPEAFEELNGRLNVAFGYPDEAGTESYAEPIRNPFNETQVAVTIQDRALAYLTDAQIISLVDESAIADWFKGPPI